MASGHTIYETLGNIPAEYNHVVATGVVITGLAAVGLVIKAKLKNVDEHVLPEPKANLVNISAGLVSGIKNQAKDIIGHGAEQYIPLLGTTFLFILCSNLLGTIPGFYGATQNLNANLAVALFIFIFYNFAGIREHGLPYFKQFMGGLPPKGSAGLMAAFLFLIGLAMIFIEGIGHIIRPASLSLRLWGNLTGDHTLVDVFLGIVPLGLPIVFMAFGLFVALIQAIVFTLLSTVYIKLAVSHDH